MNKYTLIIIAVLISAIAYSLLSVDQEAQIRQEMAKLESSLAMTTSENRLEALTKAKEISNFFTKDFSARSEASGERQISFKDRQEFQNKIAAYRVQGSKLEVKLQIQEIEIEDETATLESKAAILGSFSSVEGVFFDLHLIEINLRQVSGTWKVSGATHLENLRGEIEE